MKPLERPLVLDEVKREEKKAALTLQDYLDSIKVENLKNKR